MRFCCLINPFSGGKQGRLIKEKLDIALKEGKFEGKVLEIVPERIKEQVEYSLMFDGVLVGGGDGTISNVMQHIGDSEITMGLIPLGTGNDLARELGIYNYFSKQDPLGLIKFYETAATRELSIWKVKYGDGENRLFINYLSIGFDGVVVECVDNIRYRFPLIFKYGAKWGNRLAYVGASLAHFNKGKISFLKLKDLESGSEFKEDNSITSLIFSNISSIMGFGVSNPNSSGFDKRIEVMLVRSPWEYFSMLTSYSLSFSKPKHLGSSSNWKILAINPPLKAQVDGEVMPRLIENGLSIEFARTIKILVK